MGIFSEKPERHCPHCNSKEVALRGCSPDGTNMNYLYDCTDCGSSFKEEN